MAINNEYHLGIVLINPSVTAHPYDLESVMTQDFGDLTAVYVFENQDKYALISKEFCEMNNIRIDELHEAALQQQRRNYVYKAESLDVIVQDMMPEIIEPGDVMPYPVMVVSMDNDVHGASVILQPEVLIAIEELLGGDYFILPTSIHEVMVVPDLGIDCQERDLNEMVQDANDLAVAPEERLSDRVIRASDFLRLIEPPERKVDRGPQL